MRYQFTGTNIEEFPTLLVKEGSLIAKPGDVIVLERDPVHARLVPLSGKVAADDRHATFVDEVVAPTPTPED